MTMVPSLVNIFDRLQELMPDVSMAFGLEYMEENVAPPRIVMVPTEDEDMPMSRSDPMNSVQRSVGSIAAGVEFFVWGAGTEQELAANKYAHVIATEALRNRLLWFVHQVAPGAYRRQGGQWQETDIAQFGRAYIQRAQFHLPIVPEISDITTAVIQTSLELGGAVYPSSVVITPEPAP